MSTLLIRTQYMENYGAHDWDGTGDCPQYWKYKGGGDYKAVVPADFPLTQLDQLVKQLEPQVQVSDNYQREYILHWQLVPDDYLTQSEQDQLRWEGKVSYPARVLTVDPATVAVLS
jgi:hypothetical protein